jgi:hypothetical protein
MKTEGIFLFIASLLLTMAGVFLAYWTGYQFRIHGLSGLYASVTVVFLGTFLTCLTLDVYWIGTRQHKRRIIDRRIEDERLRRNSNE